MQNLNNIIINKTENKKMIENSTFLTLMVFLI